MTTVDFWQKSLAEAQQVLEAFTKNIDALKKCEAFAEILTKTLASGGHVFICGNGGSHCDAMHFAEELTGRFRKDRRPLGALALGDASHLSCVGNDYGFEHVFSRQLQALSRTGDLLVAISTSGNSPNVLKAVEVAKLKNLHTVGLLGRDGGKLKAQVEIPVVVPVQSTERIQEMHIKIIHTVIEAMERQLFPENY